MTSAFLPYFTRIINKFNRNYIVQPELDKILIVYKIGSITILK
jgi:hypothetical protein